MLSCRYNEGNENTTPAGESPRPCPLKGGGQIATIVSSSTTNADVIALAVKFVSARVEHQLATIHAADHAALIASGMTHGEIVDRLVVRAIKAMTPAEVAQAAAQEVTK